MISFIGRKTKTSFHLLKCIYTIIHNLLQDVKHLYRAACFADWCLTRPKHQEYTPDRPYSLFEGTAKHVIIKCYNKKQN